MFRKNVALTEIKGIENFNTSHVKEAMHAFYECSSLTSLDLSKWDTGNMESMYEMFASCSSLETLKLGPKWSIDSIKHRNLYGMFAGCSVLSLDCSGWQVPASEFQEDGTIDSFNSYAPGVIPPIKPTE